MAIGLATSLYQGSMQSWLIPLVLVAIVFVLYKFPPTRWRNPPGRGRKTTRGPRPDFRRSANAKSDKRRTSSFTVIEGRKDKEDEPPRYH
ncbi:hypothetical protein D7Z26_04170 [Cohnella endophytica]|uniref:Uncharacterized protein n=2 Tax=Cohnella endophytica TaxID=2419778 RepID=A0A494Y3S5_9BACL|nr:hypothetical protein D7Z26_04170 [Cohnella endophytica]